jgi:hypothetical protein
VSYASEIIEDYFRRTGKPGDLSLDAVYQYEMTLLRDMLGRLEVILDDEGVEAATAKRVIRCMLYGSPSPAAAEMRMRQESRMADLLACTPPMPVQVPGELSEGARKLLGPWAR